MFEIGPIIPTIELDLEFPSGLYTPPIMDRKSITAIRRCSRKHCQNHATGIPVLRIPAKGCPLAEHEPLSVEIGMPLCTGHSLKVRAGEFLTPKCKQLVRDLCKRHQRAQPDFARAFVRIKDV
jgi:hypothetical protein